MKRLRCLDGLRGVLAVYVLMGHMAPFGILPAWLQSSVSHGGAAVDLFFILSGLVIAQSLQGFGAQPRSFLVARFARIYPVYLPVLAVAVLVQPMSCGFERMPWIGWDDAARSICVGGWPAHGVGEVLAHLTMMHGLYPQLILPDVWVSFLGAAWSLSAEWQFYCLALIVRDRDRLIVLLLGLAAAATLWRFTGPENWQFSRAFLPNQGQYFALGVASAGLVLRRDGAMRTFGTVLLLTLALCATSGMLGKLLPPFVWVACLIAQLRPRLVLARTLHSILVHPVCLYFGATSYCLYLVNEPIHKLLGAALSRVADGDAALFTVLWVPGSIGLPLLAADLLHRKLEMPALAWGRLLAKRVAAPDAPALHPATVPNSVWRQDVADGVTVRSSLA